MVYPPPDPTQKGTVYGRFQQLSGAERALVSQAQADALYGSWITQALNAGDYLSVLAFITAWDQSQPLLDPTINDRTTPAPYGGFSSQTAWDLRRAAGDWVNQYRDTYDQIQKAAMLLTGGAQAVAAQDAVKTLSTPVEVAAYTQALRQGATIEDALSTAAAAAQSVAAETPDMEWAAAGMQTGGQEPPPGTIYVVDSFDNTYGGTLDGILPGVANDAPGALLPGSVAAPGLPDTIGQEPAPVPVPPQSNLPGLQLPKVARSTPAWAWIAAAVAAVVILSRKGKGD